MNHRPAFSTNSEVEGGGGALTALASEFGFSRRLLALFAFPALISAAPLRAETVFDSISQEVRAVFDRCKDSVVKIEATDEHGQLCGTGFFVDPNGTLYTSYSVGGQSRAIVVSRGDKKWTATRLVGDPRSGIAILKVEAQTPCLPLGKTDSLEVASPVMTVGFPMDLPVTPNFGVVGGFDIKHQDRYFHVTHIRANLPVQRGEGGSPLLNMNGEVIGVLISCVDNGSGCFALPIEAAEKVRNDYRRFGEVRPGWLGISSCDASNEVEGSIAQVESLIEGAPAAKGGLHPGDILLELGGRKIKSRGDILNAVFFISAGDEVPVTVSRGGEKIALKIEAADNPSMQREAFLSPASPMQMAPLHAGPQ